MAYLLALIIPISFFYSPRIEKTNVVLFTKPMTISQERNTPAYNLFQQAQLVQKENKNEAIERAPANSFSELTLNDVRPMSLQPTLRPMNIAKDDLDREAEKQLIHLMQTQPDSTLLSNYTVTTAANMMSTNTSTNPQPLVNNYVDQSNQLNLVKGHFELKDGVGITDHLVSLKRVISDQTVEIGQVNLNEGSYQIFTQSLDGEIVAEIRDRTGFLIGYDRQELRNSKKQNQYFEGPTLKVGKPKNQVATLGVNPYSVDGRSVKAKSTEAYLFSGLYGLKNPTESYPNVSKYSSTLSVVRDLNKLNATTYSVRTTNDQTQTVLFKKSWVEGSIAYLSDQLQIQFMPQTGVIIGRVVINGVPVAGAQVVVENQPGLEPYYLDGMYVPQKNQVSTSDTGYFILPGVSSGQYQLTAYLNNKSIATQLYFVEPDVVTYQELYSIGIDKNILAQSFDVFSGQLVNTEIQVPGIEDILSTEEANSNLSFKQQGAFGLEEIINRPLDREYTNYIYLKNLNSDKLYLPQIKENFFEYLATQAKVAREPNTSLFVGFTPVESFDVHLSNEQYEKSNIVYFDYLGRTTAQQTPGGGFVLFNIPQGIQEIILQEAKSEKSYSLALYSRADVVFVSHFQE